VTTIAWSESVCACSAEPGTGGAASAAATVAITGGAAGDAGAAKAAAIAAREEAAAGMGLVGWSECRAYAE
jgi:hypothetical protein